MSSGTCESSPCLFRCRLNSFHRLFIVCFARSFLILFSQRKSSTTLFSLSRTLIRGNRSTPVRRRVSDPDPVAANAASSASAGVALRNSSSAPSRSAPW
ncbi:unnamed protein product, partial [Ectocarpus sp. 4 AP-2014]